MDQDAFASLAQEADELQGLLAAANRREIEQRTKFEDCELKLKQLELDKNNL